MDRFGVIVFVDEIKTQAEWARNAFEVLTDLHFQYEVQGNSSNVRARLMSEHFRNAHSFLTHVSNVSRLVWPPALTSRKCFCKKNQDKVLCKHCVSRARADVLQKCLGLEGEDHVLIKRTLRDHLEHFDERLDEWHGRSPKRNYFQDNFFSKSSMSGVEEDCMRQLDPDSMEFLFRGEAYSLIELLEGVEDILKRVSEAQMQIEHPPGEL